MNVSRRPNASSQTGLPPSENEQRRLHVSEAVARLVHTSLEPTAISEAALAAIGSHLNPRFIFLHQADPLHRSLRLLHISPTPDDRLLQAIRRLGYGSSFPAARAPQQRDPILIEDLQAPAVRVEEGLGQSHPLLLCGARGYLCVPLWFADTCEGALSALFSFPLRIHGQEEQVLVGCGLHLAAALAHARLYAEVEQERSRLRLTLDQVPEGVLIAESSAGLIRYANAMAASLLGVPLSSLVGSPFHAYPQTGETRQWQGRRTFPWNYALIRAFCGETVTAREAIVTRPDGTTLFALCSSAPLRTANGDVPEAILLFQDISAQVSLEQHKNAFLATLSHELRTPVTAIQGFAEILQLLAAKGTGLTGPNSVRMISHIVTQSEMLAHLIGEMLDVASVEQAHLALVYDNHDLLKLVASTVETMAATTTRHRLHLILEGLPDSGSLPGRFDGRRIRQVLSNLIGNAIKYSPAGGEIEVGVRWTEACSGEALLWVRDEGIGIASAELEHLFIRFHRAGSLDPALSGLGIGLYLAKELMTRHGGHIRVESTEGKGSTFFLRLPLAHQGASSPPSPESGR
jgi:signal transduction histidine kinase